jgi:Spy/CpxP family protein refolding chaperone
MKKLCAVLPLLCVLLFAQENETSDPRAIIEKIRIYRLSKELDLTTEQAIGFFPKLNELQKIDKEFQTQQDEILDELRTLLRNRAPDKEISGPLNKFEAIFRERVERQLKKMGEIRKMLTPSQQAKYLIFQDDFEREIRRMIKEVKKLRPR